MPGVLTDEQIADLLSERKQLPKDWRSRLKTREKTDHRYRQRELSVTGEAGNKFRLVARENMINPLDFSVMLIFVGADNALYRLLRCNGRHPSRHTNKYEKARNLPNPVIYDDFHVHRATERYQLEFGHRAIDGYAEATDAYDSLESATLHLLREGGFDLPEQEEGPTLFEPGGN